MTRAQRLVIVLLGIADVVVIGCLIGTIVFFSPAAPDPTGDVSPLATATQTEMVVVLPPTNTLPPVATLPPTPTAPPTRTPAPTRTPIPTSTPRPTGEPTEPSDPGLLPVVLLNAGFDTILPGNVPGWKMEATVNFQQGDAFNPDSSFASPAFKSADDPRRLINGSTLQIESSEQYVKFSVVLYQTVTIRVGSQAQFEIQARGYSEEGGINVRAGIDPDGGAACEGGLWGEMQTIDQTGDVVTLSSPEVVVSEGGHVTICFFAEPEFPVNSKAAFFDEALLLSRMPTE